MNPTRFAAGHAAHADWHVALARALDALLLELRPAAVSFHFGLPPRDWVQALRATGRPILYSVCEWGANKPWLWAGEAPVNATSWRTTCRAISMASATNSSATC